MICYKKYFKLTELFLSGERWIDLSSKTDGGGGATRFEFCWNYRMRIENNKIVTHKLI